MASCASSQSTNYINYLATMDIDDYKFIIASYYSLLTLGAFGALEQ